MKRKRADRQRRYVEANPEFTVAVEIMCIALSRFRSCENWQRIGEVGRWATPWLSMWRGIGAAAEQASRTLAWTSSRDAANFHVGMALEWGNSSLQTMYKQPYRFRVTAIDKALGIITMESR